MLRLDVSAYHAGSGRFIVIGQVALGSPDGSFSDNPPGGPRQVYIFGVDPVEHLGYVQRSRAGVDVEVGAQRRIRDRDGFEVIATFGPGESYDMIIRTDVSAAARKMRLTCRDD